MINLNLISTKICSENNKWHQLVEADPPGQGAALKIH